MLTVKNKPNRINFTCFVRIFSQRCLGGNRCWKGSGGGLKKSHISNWWSLYYCHPIIIVSPPPPCYGTPWKTTPMLSCTIHFCPVKFLLVTHCWTYDSIVIADVVFFILNSPHNVLQINHHYSYFAIENYGQKKSPKQILWIKDKKFASWNNENPILEG